MMSILNCITMKIRLLLFFLLSFSWCSCQQEAAPGDGGRLTVNLAGMSPTKALVGASPAEMQVNSLNLYVFDANGMLDLSHACTGEELSARQAVLSVKTGGKTVYALANFRGTPLEAANACATRAALEQVAFRLGDNLPDGLLMTASASATVAPGSGGSATLELTRPVARVALGSVTNSLPAPYGTVRVLRAFLCNVVGNQDVGGIADPGVWYNPNATPDNVAGHVIGTAGYSAQEAALTYLPLDQDLALGASHTFSQKYCYAFPNALTNPNNGHTANFTPTATVLMVVVQIRNVPYYYPVALTRTLERNKDYKVDLTLVGLGNTEDRPFDKIEKSYLTAQVRVSDWSDGATYNETL